MRGRYYLKHTINHTVDNQYRIKQLNENYKSMINAYSGVSGRRFRKHPDTKPALSGHLVS